MKICHVCGFEAENEAELCPVCGAELSGDGIDENGNDAEAENFDIVIENPELAASIDDPVTAEIYCDLLKENGILFTSDEPDLASTMRVGFGGYYSAIDIYVDKNDLEKAKEIYDNLPDAFETEEEFEEEE